MDVAGFWHALLSVWLEEAAEFAAIFRGSPHGMWEFVFVYPFVVSCLWTVSALHVLLLDRPARRSGRPEACAPRYAVLIPFYAEVADAVGAARSLSEVEPPPDEIILIDDGSPPDAGGDRMTLPPRTRVLRNPVRQGKAGALNTGLAHVQSEVVVCMDADSRAITRDWTPMLERFRDPRLAAVTGKVWPAAATGAIELLQALDYLAVICLIKAAETLWGGLMTVSGAWVAFRRDALLAHGGWNTATAAEDIDLSWWLQSRGWKILYAPEWTATVETAPTWRALWCQRRRWSAGLGRAVRDHLGASLARGGTNLPTACLTVVSLFWLAATITVGTIAASSLVARVLTGAVDLSFLTVDDWWRYAAISQAVFLSQFAVAVAIDKRPAWRYPLLAVLSPLYVPYFWLLLMPSAVVGLPRGLLHRDRGVWRRTSRHGEPSGRIP